MKLQSRTRSLATAALVALLVASFGAAAAPQPRENQRQEHRDDRKEQRQERRDDRKERRNDRKEQRQERRADHREQRQDRRDDRRDDRQDRRQDHRQAQQRQRQAERQRERAQQRYYQQRVAQQRAAQQRYHARYQRNIRAQQARLNALRYDYRSNPYRHLPATYRYSYGGSWHSTNRYGADMLRDAVRRGYQEGLRAGRADRYDRWSNGYRDSRVWIDASYGYDNYYVRRADYQHYFRQGFERGYEDGYYSRQRYGRYDDRNDTAIILTTVLAAILGLQAIG